METKKYESPKLELLTEVMDEATKCKTFGMPKRSCKALPSGLSSRIETEDDEEAEIPEARTV